MSRSSLDAIFKPTSICVVGASDKPGSVGGSIVINLRRAGFAGRLSVVNTHPGNVHGYQAYGSIDELPDVPDAAIICTPAATVPGLIRQCGRRGVHGLIIVSSGFREAGADGQMLERELKAASQEFRSLRFVGPNCLGVIKPGLGLNASFSPASPIPGGITLLSQSGALCTAIIDWAIGQQIGFATCVSVGNTTNIGMSDLIEYFAEDPETDALLLYIEGLDDASRFIAAAQRCSRHKPVIAYKAGRFAESSKAAASHTGAMASSDEIYQCAFRRAGVERANSIEELFDCAKLLVGRAHEIGPRLAIVTNAGGPGVMACDAWLALGRHLAQLTPETMIRLNEALPRYWSRGNPIDVLGDATVERFQVAFEQTLADPNVDALLVIVTPQTVTDPTGIAKAIVKAQQQSHKQIIASLIGGRAVHSGKAVLETAGIPSYDFPEAAAHALNHLLSVNEMRARTQDNQKTFGSPQTHSVSDSPRMSRERIAYWRTELQKTDGLLGEVRSKELLAEYGIPTVISRIASSVDDAAVFAQQIGFPVVLKVVSPDISHKTDVGGVALDIPDADSARSCYDRILQSARDHCPEARIYGVSVQQMVSEVRGVELLLGLKRDPQFGPVLLVGAGGITAELQRDTALELQPFDNDVIRRMLQSLRLYPLLEGYRGRPGVNLPQLQSVVKRFSQLGDDFPEISVVEINPLLVSAENVVALDARIIITRSVN